MRKFLTISQKLEKRIHDSIEGWIIYLQKQVNDPECDYLYYAIPEVLKIPFKEIPLRLNDHTENSPQYKILKYRLAHNLVKADSNAFLFTQISAEVTCEGLLEEYQSGDSDDALFLKREFDVAHHIFKEFNTISKGLVSRELRSILTLWNNALDNLCSQVFER